MVHNVIISDNHSNKIYQTMRFSLHYHFWQAPLGVRSIQCRVYPSNWEPIGNHHRSLSLYSLSLWYCQQRKSDDDVGVETVPKRCKLTTLPATEPADPVNVPTTTSQTSGSSAVLQNGDVSVERVENKWQKTRTAFRFHIVTAFRQCLYFHVRQTSMCYIR